MINKLEILQTIDMIDQQHLDIRTITMGISLRDCSHPDPDICCRRIYDKITRLAERLVPVGGDIEREFGIPIVNKRIAVTPISLVAESCETEALYPLRCRVGPGGENLRRRFHRGLLRLSAKRLYRWGPATHLFHSVPL
jgi:uncharacterized protein (UPF0210 family)